MSVENEDEADLIGGWRDARRSGQGKNTYFSYIFKIIVLLKKVMVFRFCRTSFFFLDQRLLMRNLRQNESFRRQRRNSKREY